MLPILGRIMPLTSLLVMVPSMSLMTTFSSPPHTKALQLHQAVPWNWVVTLNSTGSALTSSNQL